MTTLPLGRAWQRLATAPAAIWQLRSRSNRLQQVGIRLTVQTIAVLLIMLIALEGVVYVITQRALLGSLQASLRERAAIPAGTVCDIYHLGCQRFDGSSHGPPRFPPGSVPITRVPDPGRGRGFTGPNPDSFLSDASVVFVSTSLAAVHADGALGRVILSAPDARLALATSRSQCCSVASYRGRNYLVYSAPLFLDGRTVGVAQSSISQHEYEQTMAFLVQALLTVALLGLIFSSGISIVLVRRALKPVRMALERQQDFVADAAHELRTPLAIQRTVGEIGMNEATMEDLQSTIVQMLGENQHLTRLVDDLSLLARTDTEAVGISRAPIDLSSLVQETTRELSYLAEEQGVRLHLDDQGGVGVMGDSIRLRQLLLILLDNALKHTPAGGQINVRLTSHGGRAGLDVADTGPGIDVADLPRIFDRFYQADEARTGQGTGLGLSIGKWIVEAHGGHIEAVNLMPHGALFSVSLPQARSTLSQ